MKKTTIIGALAGAAALTGTLLAGAAGAGAVPLARQGTATQTVTMWMYPLLSTPSQDTSFWNGIARGFEAKYPKVSVNIDQLSWASRTEGVPAAFASGKLPDLMLMIPDQIPQYAALGDLEAAGPEVGSGASRLLSAAIKGMSYDGKLYGVPLYVDSTTTIYNKKLFAKAGISQLPQTWAQVKADAVKMAAKGIPILDYWGSPEETLNQTFYPFLWQAGGQVYSANGKKVVVNSPQGVAALSFLVDLEKDGGMPQGAAVQSGSTFETTAIATGHAAMIQGQDLSTAEELATLLGKGNVAVGLPLRDVTDETYGTVGGLVIPKGASNLAGVKDFVQYLESLPIESKIQTATGLFSPLKTSPVPNLPFVRPFIKALPLASPGYQYTTARQMLTIVATQVQAALLGKESPKQALDTAAAQGNSLLQQASG